MAKGNPLSTVVGEIGGQFPSEVANIREARLANPTTPAKKLAKRLARGLAEKPGIVGRSILSIYSVIRRYDAARKANGL